MAIEENYWAEVRPGRSQQHRVDGGFSALGSDSECGTGDGQSEARADVGWLPGVGHPGHQLQQGNVDFLKDWKDLADERLKGKVLLWLPGDITAGGMLLGMWRFARARLPQDPTRWTRRSISSSTRSVRTCSSTRPTTAGGRAVAALRAARSMRPVLELASRPQVPLRRHRRSRLPGRRPPVSTPSTATCGFRSSPSIRCWPRSSSTGALATTPSSPTSTAGASARAAWAELQEGFMGPSYEGRCPDWIKDVYFDYFPTIDQLSTIYKSVRLGVLQRAR